jgi:acyl-coenzyme A thioesterase PaaI-like protein
MITLSPGGRVYLACGVTDMRKGAVGLAILVQQSLLENPFDGSVTQGGVEWHLRDALAPLLFHDTGLAGARAVKLTNQINHLRSSSMKTSG